MISSPDSQASLPPSPAFPARVGLRILGFFEWLFGTTRMLLRREQAVVEGFGAVVARVLLSAALPAACLYLALLYEQILQRLGPLIGLQNDGRFTSDTALILILAEIVCAGWSAFLLWSDAEDKWRTLHWIYFGMFAGILLNCYSPALLLLAVAGVHFAFHYAIHAAFRARDAMVLIQMEARERPGPPDLLKQYSGVKGFDDSTAKDQP